MNIAGLCGPSSVRGPHKTGSFATLSDDDVDEPLWNNDHLRDITAFDGSSDLFIRKRSLAQFVVARGGVCEDTASQLAIHLHGDFDLLFASEI